MSSTSTDASNVPMDLVSAFDDHGDELAHAPPPASMDVLGTTCLGDETELCSHCGMPVRGEEPHEDVYRYILHASVRSMAALVCVMFDVNAMTPRFRPTYDRTEKMVHCFPQCSVYKHCPAPYQHSHDALTRDSLAAACSVPICATFQHEGALSDARAFGYFHHSGLSMDEDLFSFSPAELAIFSSQWVVGDVEHHGDTKTSVLFYGFSKDEVLWLLPDDFAHPCNTQGVLYTFRVLLYAKVGDLYELVAYQDSPEFAVHNSVRDSKRKPTATLAEKNPKHPRVANAVTSA
ncbi:hypothetical protein SPRG_15801 [Saprolegnia parasitica CBS 223.65]|uniref:Uncharacterized protein n=1 Tax=Saprolegnia parasitica (strain CBS 223.65) TaxID=695850 RepID=A0A067BXA3_SAPPC|nr:hypothetical protein SPRG_15801 [Saprolegnia parasitica CBS 223.65]KDO18946.1 hypothetical protein SPRG_15801 [Saprolegnia parasitica CBS 223.65]|eukprot:XP_012210359.1 hypothetical protein SPRG_15801 [Saprolegnia parasitica CBS 223.65]